MITLAFWLLVVGLTVPIGPARTDSDGATPQLSIPNGQLKSSSVRVYISRDLAPNQQPHRQSSVSRSLLRAAAS